MRLASIFFTLAAFCLTANASETCPEQQSKQRCYVWAGDRDGNYVNRKDVEFLVKSGTFLCDGRPNSPFEWESEVDGKVVAVVRASWDSYSLSLFKESDSDRSRPLGTGSFKRSGLWGDFVGFSVYTTDAEYTIACASMDE